MVTWLLRSLLVLLFLVLLAIGLVAFVEPRLDLSAQRDWIGARLSALTGQHVRIDGDVLLSVGRHTHLAITGLQVESQEPQRPVLRVAAEEAALGIDVPALFGGVLQLEGAALRDAQILVRTDAQEEVFAKPSPVGDALAGYQVVLADLAARNVTLTYARRGHPPIELTIGHLDQRGGPSGLLEISSRGRVNDLPVALEGRVGPLTALMAARDIDVDLDARLGETAVTARGRLGQPGRLQDVSLTASARGPSLSALLTALRVPHERGGDIDLNLQVTDRDRGLSWRSSGRLGPLSLDTHGVLEQPLELDGLHLTAWFSGEDLDSVGRVFGIAGLPAHPFRLTGEVRRSQGDITVRDTVFEAGPTRARLTARLPHFPNLDASVVHLALTTPEPEAFAGALGLPAPPSGPLDAQVRVAPGEGATTRIEAQASLGGHALVLSGGLGPHPGYEGTALEVALSGPNLAELALAPLPDRPYRLAGQLRFADSGGLSFRSSDASLGSARLSVDGSLGHPPGFAGANLGVSLDGPSLRGALGSLLGQHVPDQAFTVNTRLLGDLRRPALGNLALRTNDLRLDTTGKLGLPPRLDGTDLRFLLQVDDPARLAGPDSAIPAGPLRLSGAVRAGHDGLAIEELLVEGEYLELTGQARLPGLPQRGRGEARLELAGTAGATEWSSQALIRWSEASLEVRDLRAILGEGELAGTLSITGSGDGRPQLMVKTRARDLDLRDLFAALPARGAEPAPAADARLPLDWLGNTDGRFELDASGLRYPDPQFPDATPARRIRIDAEWRDAVLHTRALEFDGDRGTVTASLSVDASADLPRVAATVSAEGLKLGLHGGDQGIDTLPAHRAQVQLTARGETWGRLIASADGSLRVTGGPGRIDPIPVTTAQDFLRRLFGALNPHATTQTATLLECTAARGEITGGRLALSPGAVVRTDKADISATGVIDLGERTIDVVLRTAPREGLGLSVAGTAESFVRIGGKLDDPKLQLEPSLGALNATAAVATGGLSVLATELVQRAHTLTNPCEAVLAGAAGRPDQQVPAAQPSVLDLDL